MSLLRQTCFALLICAPLATFSQQDSKPVPIPKDPVLVKRPPLRPDAIREKEGRIHLDVLVTGTSGKPVAGLALRDFTLLDDNQPQQIVSFHAFGSDNQPPEPPTEVILILDTINAEFAEVSSAREQIEKFLQKSGHLAQPMSIFLLADAGLVSGAGPSDDGPTLARALHTMKSGMHSITAAQGADGQLARLQRSVKTLASIGNNAAKKPGRKLLIWTGRGWPTLRGDSDTYSARGHQLNFETIISLSTGLREARMELCSTEAGSEFFVKDYMRGVRTAKQANSGDLALTVLAVQSGGQSLDAGNHGHAEEQLRTCLADAGAYYRISFDPSKAPQPREYHDLKVLIDIPGLKARTNTGYYDKPEQLP